MAAAVDTITTYAVADDNSPSANTVEPAAENNKALSKCQALASTAVEEAKPTFTRLFKEYGLPKRIRTDDGVPFATNALARLSRLSAWWVRLGILPELIEPGRPAQNGRHERLNAGRTHPNRS